MQARLATKQQLAQYQVKTLSRSIKTTPPESFKGQMNGDTVETTIDKLYIYFAVCVLDNTFSRAAFAVTLSGSAYTQYITQHYAIGAGHANRLTWECLKSDIWSYFKPLDYAYQT